MEFQTTDKLRAYIQKIDDLAENLKIDILKNIPFLSPTLQSEEFQKNQEIIRTGCRVWVRWINDVDRSLDSNIQFVQQKEDSVHGRNGIKFWQIMSTKANVYQSSLSSSGNPQSINLVPYLAKMAPYGEVLFAVVGLLSDNSTKIQYVQDLIIDDFAKLVNCFFEFIDNYKKEYSLQFPDIIEKVDTGNTELTSITKNVQAPVNSANINQSISDFISNNKTFIGIGLGSFIGFQILKYRKNA